MLYSRGDNDRQQQQLLEEAALLLLDRPPSFSESYGHASVRFTAHMDIDTASVIRSMARSPACGSSTFIATPSRQRSGTLTAELLLEEGSSSDGGGGEGGGEASEELRPGFEGSPEGRGQRGVRLMVPGGEDSSLGYHSPWRVAPVPAVAGLTVSGDEDVSGGGGGAGTGMGGATAVGPQRREGGVGGWNGMSSRASR